MKPALTYRESRVIETAREALAKCDYTRARRTEPETRIDREPLAAAIKRWYGRVLQPATR